MKTFLPHGDKEGWRPHLAERDPGPLHQEGVELGGRPGEAAAGLGLELVRLLDADLLLVHRRGGLQDKGERQHLGPQPLEQLQVETTKSEWGIEIDHDSDEQLRLEPRPLGELQGEALKVSDFF